MIFKKIAAFALSATMAFTCMVSFNSAYANEISDQYFKDMTLMSKWDKVESNSTMNVDFNYDSKTNPSSNISGGYSFTSKSIADVKNLDQYTELDIKEKGQAPAIPSFKMYFNMDGNFFINKDFATFLFDKLGLESQDFTTDFVKIKSKNLSSPYKNIGDVTDITTKSINFLKGIDLGDVDLGLAKSGNSYTIDMDTKQMIDALNGYCKFIYKNPDYLFDYYEEVLGMDLAKISQISQEELDTTMSQAYDMWVKNVEPRLGLFETILQGSHLTMKETFDKDNKSYTSSIDLNIKVNIFENIDKLFDETIPKASELGNVEDSATFTIKSKANTKQLSNLEINIPESSDVYDLDEALAQKQKELEEMMAELQGATYTVDTKTNSFISTTAKGEETSPIKTQLRNGSLYVEADALASFTGISVQTTQSDKMVSFKDVMENAGYTVTWDNEAKTSTAVK